MPNLNVGLGTTCAVIINAQADEHVYVLTNCDNISSSSSYFEYCESSYPGCGSDMARACNTASGEYGYGAVLTLDGTRYLVCFHNDDAEACLALRDGCSSQYSLATHDLILKEGVSVDSLNRAENIEQLKCCYTYTQTGFEDIGNGIQCASDKICEYDGTMTTADELCSCSPGYYSTAEYDSAPGRDYMSGACAPCDNTIGDLYVTVPPTSNGGGYITSCYLKEGTQGLDIKGAWTISGGNCFYSN